MKRLDYKIGEIAKNEVTLTKYEIITKKIIEALESNTVPWKKPWISLRPQNLFSKKEYRGINFLLLSMVPTKYPYFATFKQVQEAGGVILKGSKSLPVYFFSPVDKKENPNVESETESKSYYLMKQYNVFTCEQIDGIDFSYRMANLHKEFNQVERAEEIISKYIQSQNIKLLPSQEASYTPSIDCLSMPQKENFDSEGAYYSTIFHEIIHSTGNTKRLNRKGFGINEYHNKGSEGYAFEELVAEFGAAMLSSYCGIDNSIEVEQSTAYIKNWLNIFKADPTIAYKAASKAQSAVDYVLKSAGVNLDSIGED